MNIQPIHFHESRAKRTKPQELSPQYEGSDIVIGEMRLRKLGPELYVAIATTGDWEFIDGETFTLLARQAPLPLELTAKLSSKFLLTSPFTGRGTTLLKKARLAAKRSTIDSGPALHIIVPTLQCGHSCQYCQVSRSIESIGHTMSIEDLDASCDAVFNSTSTALTIEFQGGDPLLRFDLVERAILRIKARNVKAARQLRFVVASTLHQLTSKMCEFFKEHDVCLSTSIDGPAWLHNKNRPTKGKDSFERTVAGIALARSLIGPNSVAALMTTTRLSLDYAYEIVDEYVSLGFNEIFLRPLSTYGFAKRNHALLGYSVEEFQNFYDRALERILWWNDKGTELREVYCSIICNKIFSTFDAGYVDLQSPTGAGRSVLVYNYDGYIYPSDEARMLTETGDSTLRVAPIRGNDKCTSDVIQRLYRASEPNMIEGCTSCAYHAYCGPNPVDAQAQHGTMSAPVRSTEHCNRHLILFDRMFRRIEQASVDQLNIFHSWAQPALERGES